MDDGFAYWLSVQVCGVGSFWLVATLARDFGLLLQDLGLVRFIS